MMRCLLVFSIALSLQAQTSSFYFHPRIGSPGGGDAIRFVANLPSIDFRSTAPQVFFGGIASPRVTVIDSRTLTAVTPAHAEGVVAVELRLSGTIWAMLTLTDNRSQRVTVLTSQ